MVRQRHQNYFLPEMIRESWNLIEPKAQLAIPNPEMVVIKAAFP